MDARFQHKLKELDEELGRLLNELKKYSSAQLSARPEPGAWSVFQVMQHLMIAESKSIGYVKKKTSYPEGLKKAGFLGKFREAGLKLFLWLPFKFKAPAIVNEDQFRENVSLDELAAAWRASRGELAHFIENMKPEWADKEIFRHALAGRMPVDGMLTFFADHFARHRKQIDRTLQKVVSANQASRN